MKMAKASEADLSMAMELTNALELLCHRHIPCMPQAIERLEGYEESERFDFEDDEQCGRALRHLLEIADRASLMRVVWGFAVLLDPANRVVDQSLDHLERHPDYESAEKDRQDAALYRWLRDTRWQAVCNAISGGEKVGTPDEFDALARAAMAQPKESGL